jgi:predicted dehydrogenase
MNIFIVGFGRMGQRHFEIVRQYHNANVFIFDLNKSGSTGPDGIIIRDPKLIQSYLKEIKPSLVVISTTAPSHFDYLKWCMEEDIEFVLCEKPVCVSLKEAHLLCQLSQNSKTKIAINHQMRFMEQYTRIKDLIANDGFGSLRSISVQGGNFGLSMNGTHYFEMFRFMTDSSIQKVWALLKPQEGMNPRGKDFWDVAGIIWLKNEKGQRFHMDISDDQGHGIFVIYTCAYGQIYVDELSGYVYTSRRKNSEDLMLPTTRYGMPSVVNNFHIEPADSLEPTARVLKSLLAGENFPTLHDGIAAIRTLVAAYESSDNQGSCIDINHIFPLYEEKIFPWA